MRCRSRLMMESFEAPLEAEENIATALSVSQLEIDNMYDSQHHVNSTCINSSFHGQ